MSKPLKALLNHSAVVWVLSFLVSLYIRFVAFTTRWERRIPQSTKDLLATGTPVIFTFWHGRLLILPRFVPKNHALHVVISQHKDGEAIARVSYFLGVKSIRGSSSKGALQALKACFSTLQKNKESIAITPDGPRGPRMRVQGSVLEIAKRTGAAIIPVSYSTSRATVIQSWDRFMLAKPFGKGIVIFGEPLYINSKATKNELSTHTAELEHGMISITQEADRIAGMPVIEAGNH